mmetsp:Transcript_32935/g.60155  ORF Transcript_32935/g.60155 Transcript_32935/m.60155 type:complete len:122 (+) Transcript_32935:449-814(+)
MATTQSSCFGNLAATPTPQKNTQGESVWGKRSLTPRFPPCSHLHRRRGQLHLQFGPPLPTREVPLAGALPPSSLLAHPHLRFELSLYLELAKQANATKASSRTKKKKDTEGVGKCEIKGRT